MTLEETSPAAPQAKSRVWLAVALLSSIAATLALLKQPGLDAGAAMMGGVFVLAALLWISEALPLHATALIVILLVIVALANPGRWEFLASDQRSITHQHVLQEAASPILLLFLGGLVLAVAAEKHGVDRAMSSILLRPFSGNLSFLLLGIMLVTALFSMWMSNTATAAMMMALAAPMLARLGPFDPFRKAIVLAIAFSASLGGIGTPIGSPPNAVAIKFLQEQGVVISFKQWVLISLPLALAMLAAAWTVLRLMFRPAEPGVSILPPLEKLRSTAWWVVAIFTGTVTLWMAESFHGLPSFVVALIPVALLTATGLISGEDLKRVDWNVLILISGGITLGYGIQAAGLDKWAVEKLPLGEGVPFAVVVVILAATTTLLGTFMSNTAAANLILPVSLTIARSHGRSEWDVALIGMCVALAASMSLSLPISTPPNAVAYATGEVKTQDMAVPGVIIGVVGLALVALLTGPLMRLWMAK